MHSVIYQREWDIIWQLQCLLGHPDSGHSGLLTSPDVNPINGCFFLYKCHLYCGFTTLTLADPKIWRKSAENDAEMAQNNQKKHETSEFFLPIIPLSYQSLSSHGLL